MLKITFSAFLLCVSFLLTSCGGGKQTASYDVVPRLQEIELKTGDSFTITPTTKIVFDGSNAKLAKIAEMLSQNIALSTNYALPVSGTIESGAIVLSIDNSISNPEAYTLSVSGDGVEIKGGSEAGVFIGSQTLRKAIPVYSAECEIEMPAVVINDYPRFAYRGMMLDVARHFQPVDSIKKFIDILALHNLNTFHMHLTDDQGWRIEIEKYPKLTEIGSKRDGDLSGVSTGEYYDKPHSGFYTKEEMRGLISYAADRNITIIPEIDLPGHTLGALVSYPEIGCTGGPYEFSVSWNRSSDVICAGNEEAMIFMENVLTEIIELFPSKYIHIGGDECTKSRWVECDKCQARIRKEGIRADGKHSAEEYLQSYVISRMERHIESKGRQLIGWDEILEGGLAPNATVMSWRGVGGGIEAARQGHDVIMTPTSNLYFDYYQSTDIENEPLAIGSFLPLSLVYDFEPVPAVLTQEQAKHIIGVQANIWTEYIPTFSHLMYMTMPRIAALSEVQWLDSKERDYEDFLSRCEKLTDQYSQLGYNFAKHLFDVNAIMSPNVEKGCLEVVLKSVGDATIHYTLDGSEPSVSSDIYMTPLEIRDNRTVKAILVRPSGVSRLFSEEVVFSKSSTKPITLKHEPNEAYCYQGAAGLVDGLKGTDSFKTGRWLGFLGDNLEAVIDLQQPTEISNVALSTLVSKLNWLMDARQIVVRISDDGKIFKEVASQLIAEKKPDDRDGLYNYILEFEPTTTRYVEVVVKNGTIPKWHPGAGRPAYIFVDEIAVN